MPLSIPGNWLSATLILADLVLASANVIIGFSLLAYILTHNLRSPVAQAFSALLTFVTIVYAADVVVSNVISAQATLAWLRFQWLGIAFVPAACLHFSDALLATTGSPSRRRRVAVALAYAAGLVAVVLVAVSELVATYEVHGPTQARLVGGPLFVPFALFFFGTVALAVFNVFRARQRSLTTSSRRRMSYLTVAILAPALGVFPYSQLEPVYHGLTPNWLLALALLSNVAVAVMTVVSAYTVAYQGVFTPDRVIKHNLVHYVLRVPLLGSAILALMLVVPKVEAILGLPRDTALIFTTIIGIVLFQVLIEKAKPYIDRLIYRQDREQVDWIEKLDTRLLTSGDLQQLLENVLIALCELLRVRSGFVVAMQEGALEVRVYCGPREVADRFLKEMDWHELLPQFEQRTAPRGELHNADFCLRDGCWLLPLRDSARGSTLGILGLEATNGQPMLTPEELATVAGYVGQAELALEDMHLQQDVFAALRQIEPEIEELQRLRTERRAASPPRLEKLESNPVYAADFPEVVRDALRNLWGGPRLTDSPLLRTRLVRRTLADNEGQPARALRAVLHQGIERLRPAGERTYTSNTWLVYNILELRYVQGKQIREVADRLAMSESDFYRKQRGAIQQLAAALVTMEGEQVEAEKAAEGPDKRV
ncbi:MAG: hypothetical protein BWY10_02444 [Chloroflexi bacterium ADurb.Bin180]|nr:MAG: hypothetical protein BWY10_02444 [Chloroflexi bacterium ADurb.Bin180]HNR95820.1 histidine kinase N-terminal 7TM domain-containing protein [Anaerolineae bacterium]HQJ52333.1 histidine kinase N-terminal 7TM domain-containing protein [Anaerolineae bacterium]